MAAEQHAAVQNIKWETSLNFFAATSLPKHLPNYSYTFRGPFNYPWMNQLSKCMEMSACDVLFPKSSMLTYWGLNKMVNIGQTKFSNAFSWMKIIVSGFKFHWSLFPKFDFAICQHWLRWWLGTAHATSHYLNQILSSSKMPHCLPRPQ